MFVIELMLSDTQNGKEGEEGQAGQNGNATDAAGGAVSGVVSCLVDIPRC